MREFAKLSNIETELISAINGTSGEENRRLHDELLEVQSEKERISDLITPLDQEWERNTQELEQYLETNHGMTIRDFVDTYREDFHSWREAQ